jgi:hypothetical protein
MKIDVQDIADLMETVDKAMEVAHKSIKLGPDSECDPEEIAEIRAEYDDAKAKGLVILAKIFPEEVS